MSGTVEYIDHMGDDLAVVNAARVSFDKESTEFTTKDERLIHYLARGMTAADLDETVSDITDLCEFGDETRVREQLRKYRQRPLHWSPFAHVIVKVRVTVPFAIARQLETHQIGLAANEVSRRYVDDPPEVFMPEWRSRPENRKQGSGGRLEAAKALSADNAYHHAAQQALKTYDLLVGLGVAPEQARFVLPTATYTSWVWTGSLIAFHRVCQQRLDDHAQAEVREPAAQLAEICEELFPVSWTALNSY